MKKIIKKSISLLLCLLVMVSPLGIGSVAVSDYPDGVTEKQASNAVGATDNLIGYALPAFTGKTLNQMIKPVIYSDETLSGLVLSLYTSLGANESELSMIGLSATPNDVAGALKDYPQVSEALAKADSWGNVDLNGVKWGVTEKIGFATAVGKAFSPFNDLLYALLCSGEYTISKIIKIEGADGYTNAIVPLLQALKCEGLISFADFKSQADADKCTMVKNILLPLLELIEKGAEKPFDTLTDVFPSFAYFSESGQMDGCMDALLSPIMSNPLVEIAVFLKIIDVEAFSLDISQLLSEGIGSMAGQGGFQLAPLDLAALSKCGSHNGLEFVSHKGKAYVQIMGWLIESLKLNEGNLSQFAGGMGFDDSSDMLKELLSKSKDELVKTIILLFDPAEPGAAKSFAYPAITAVSVQYTPNLTTENYEKILKGIDSLLDEFVKEGGSYRSVEGLLSSAIYNNSNITALAKGIYGALEKEGMADALKLLGMDITPKGVAALLTESDYASAKNTLSGAKTWANVSDRVYWGFYNGSRRGFENALVAVFRPLYPLLRVVLAGEDLTVMNSITVKGASGYNDGVIPLLEALGCKSSSIKSYKQYKASSNSDQVIKAVTTPVFDLLDDIFDKPVYTLTEKLPNIVYFINNGSLEICLNNLLLPITALTDKLSGVTEFDLNTNELLKIDLNSILGDLLKDSGMKIAEFDFNSIANIGTMKEKTSKRVAGGKAVNYSYVEADQTGVLMTLLRVLAKTIKMPGNENLLIGAMGGGNNGAFATYSSSIGEQFAAMTEDELIEWLYNLLFRERAQIEIVVDENYSPTIIYKETPKDYTVLYAVGGFAGFAAIVLIVLYINRKKLYY